MGGIAEAKVRAFLALVAFEGGDCLPVKQAGNGAAAESGGSIVRLGGRNQVLLDAAGQELNVRHAAFLPSRIHGDAPISDLPTSDLPIGDLPIGDLPIQDEARPSPNAMRKPSYSRRDTTLPAHESKVL
jgi:hypothetical protein